MVAVRPHADVPCQRLLPPDAPDGSADRLGERGCPEAPQLEGASGHPDGDDLGRRDATILLAAPGGLLPAAAGLALVGTLAGSIPRATA
jgi:hypothetical protein